jgi:hypothetical protein
MRLMAGLTGPVWLCVTSPHGPWMARAGASGFVCCLALLFRTGFDGDIETWEEHQRCPQLSTAISKSPLVASESHHLWPF